MEKRPVPLRELSRRKSFHTLGNTLKDRDRNLKLQSGAQQQVNERQSRENSLQISVTTSTSQPEMHVYTPGLWQVRAGYWGQLQRSEARRGLGLLPWGYLGLAWHSWGVQRSFGSVREARDHCWGDPLNCGLLADGRQQTLASARGKTGHSCSLWPKCGQAGYYQSLHECHRQEIRRCGPDLWGHRCHQAVSKGKVTTHTFPGSWCSLALLRDIWLWASSPGRAHLLQPIATSPRLLPLQALFTHSNCVCHIPPTLLPIWTSEH